MPVEPAELIGFAASALVFLSFCMKTLLPLRLIAITSNVFFIAYGAAAGIVPVLMLHLLLLPMNMWRTGQFLRTRSRMRDALVKAPSVRMLLPFMTSQVFADGEVIFRRGDDAGRFYVIASGEVHVEEIGKSMQAGAIFGEIGLFAEDFRRTATVRARGRAVVAWIDRETFLRVCRDHPDFSLMLTRIITSRLIENQKELMETGRAVTVY